jgi:hypothetical protein
MCNGLHRSMPHASLLSERVTPEPTGSGFAVEADHCCVHVFMAVYDHFRNLWRRTFQEQ